MLCWRIGRAANFDSDLRQAIAVACEGEVFEDEVSRATKGRGIGCQGADQRIDGLVFRPFVQSPCHVFERHRFTVRPDAPYSGDWAFTKSKGKTDGIAVGRAFD